MGYISIRQRGCPGFRHSTTAALIINHVIKNIDENKLYKRYIQKPSEERLKKFKTYRNKLNNLIRKSKKEYYNKKFESVKNNLRKTWKTINCIIGRNKRSNPQTKFTNSQGCTISDPQNDF